MQCASGPCVVHSLFKEYYSCARSFSLLLPLAPLSLSRLAVRRLKKPLPTPLLTLLPLPPTPPLLRPTPLRPPRTPLLTPPVPPPTPLLTPLLRLLTPLPTLLLLRKTLPRRCNLRRTARNWGAEGNFRAPFPLPAAAPLDSFNRPLNLARHGEPGVTQTLSEGLTRALARIGLPAPQGLERLSGGANMESWYFAAGSAACVLRRAPSAELMAGRALDHHGEAEVIRAARAAGVLAPEVLVELEPDDGIGSGYVMRAITGTSAPATILDEADGEALVRDIARELAAVHRTDCTGLPVPAMDTAAALAELKARFLDYGGDRPILALAVRWLEANLPTPVPPKLVHGDLRMGNLMAENGRLTGVLDWELAHLGDPHEDLAYGCLTVWRFARPDRPAYGLASIEALTGAYAENGGEAFDPARFRFWLVYRTFWWALGCLQMGGYWRAGHDRSIERVVVARRTSEQELDLLLLLDELASEAERKRPLPPSPAPLEPGTGEPSGAEILTAVSEWLASEIKPLVSGRAKFDLAVARNALGIVAREIAQRPSATDAALAADLLAGKADLATPGLLARLRRMALDKLSADMPKYPALAIARTQWEGP